jgi:hypothetical protein
VDFPAPLGPRTTQRSPVFIRNEIGPKICLSSRITLTPSRVRTDCKVIEQKDTAYGPGHGAIKSDFAYVIGDNLSPWIKTVRVMNATQG